MTYFLSETLVNSGTLEGNWLCPVSRYTLLNMHVGLAGSQLWQLLSDGQKCIYNALMGACALDVADCNSMLNDSLGCSEEKIITVCWSHLSTLCSCMRCNLYLTVPSGCAKQHLLLDRSNHSLQMPHLNSDAIQFK